MDPLILSLKLVDVCECRPCDCGCLDIPPAVAACFGDELVTSGDQHRVFVSLGQFSIIRMERDTQLLIPAYDYCMPSKECTAGGGVQEDPCAIFRQVQFPMEEFFPPNTIAPPEGCQDTKNCCV